MNKKQRKQVKKVHKNVRKSFGRISDWDESIDEEAKVPKKVVKPRDSSDRQDNVIVVLNPLIL